MKQVPRDVRLRGLVDARRYESHPDTRADLMMAALLPSERRYLVSRAAVERVLGAIPND